MAQIIINEISDNYTFNTGTGAFATVALPITAAWGPAYIDPATLDEGTTVADVLEDTDWFRFPATQQGLESFVSTFRGPSSNYKVATDYSYQIAMTLLTAGYDVLVCRVCPGTNASGSITFGTGKSLDLTAKYPGSFGNNIKVSINKLTYRVGAETYSYFNLIVYVSPDGVGLTAVENLSFTFGYNEADIPMLDELTSDFLTFTNHGVADTDTPDPAPTETTALSGGSDEISDELTTTAAEYAQARYGGTYAVDDNGYISGAGYSTPASIAYVSALANTTITDATKLKAIKQMEWCYNAAFNVYQLLKDKLNYNPNRIICPWDDQNILAIAPDTTITASTFVVSPLQKIIMDVAFFSRCATGMLDLPKSLPRSFVYNTNATSLGYVQQLSDVTVAQGEYSNNIPLFNTNSGIYGPWAPYRLVSMQKMVSVPPSFIALLIHRAQVLNQAEQYEWILPKNRKHNLKIGEPDYSVSTKLLNIWQKLEGVGVNVITKIPDLGTNVWGNSTLFDVPPATYQALANMSTRWLVNAVEDVVYRCGIAITFQYNNEQAYGKFYAGVSPILDTMVTVGAIEDYKIKMSADVNGLDQVNANTVIGKIWLVVNGVVNDIVVDLIALPQGTSLAAFGE